jgi:hypothetical protein
MMLLASLLTHKRKELFFSGTHIDVYFIKKKWERRKIGLHDATMENPQRNTRTTETVVKNKIHQRKKHGRERTPTTT